MSAPRRWLERGLFAVGLAMLSWWTLAQVGGLVVRRVASADMARAAAGAPEGIDGPADEPGSGRILGRIEVKRLGVDAVILEGTGDLALYLGVGHLAGSPLPGDAGNVVLAGHRDTYFRGLKDAAPGDTIRVTRAGAAYEYIVTTTAVVKPDEVDLIQPSSRNVLTLVTCYPFRYVGPAPKRFVVRATCLEEC